MIESLSALKPGVMRGVMQPLECLRHPSQIDGSVQNTPNDVSGCAGPLRAYERVQNPLCCKALVRDPKKIL